jgi:hypothetical protein
VARKSKEKLRPLGEITNELEPLWFELVRNHKLQNHEIIGLFLQWRQTHNMESEEQYVDGTAPVLYYGHRSGLK